MLYRGTLEWNAANAPKDQYIEVNKYSYARSKKHVKYPKGGELTLHGSFGDTIPKVCGDTACADFEQPGPQPPPPSLQAGVRRPLR